MKLNNPTVLTGEKLEAVRAEVKRRAANHTKVCGSGILPALTSREYLNNYCRGGEMVVQGLLGHGVYILAGAPKVGKSWFVLWLGEMVAEGEPVFGRETRQGDVMYLALEDSPARIQSRLLDVTDEGSELFHISNESDNIDCGLILELNAFKAMYPNAQLVIIDTLQNIRNSEKESGNVYGNDYELLRKLRDFSHKAELCIIVVHHIRKGMVTDVFNSISGSNGLSGAADGMFVLTKQERCGNEGRLSCIGRDIEPQELDIVFSKEKHIWELDKKTVEVKPLINPLITDVVDMLKSTGGIFVGTVSELADKLKSYGKNVCSICTIRKILMQNISQLEALGCIFFERRTSTVREITLLYTPPDPPSNGSV